ncbi:MAG TPA: DUF1249 domain-containing protein [Steroidobacteraceae bacterium]|nr:DUF1249 domain-containing protein [Steroidobacteraceae bacterium]
MNDSVLNDSLCAATWNSRPGSFVGLMTVYESNYVRLRQLMGDVRDLPDEAVSTPPDDCALYLRVEERSRYTVTFTLTYRFLSADQEIAEPDLQIRVYHDARLAEALHCSRWRRHPTLCLTQARELRVMRTHGDQRWQRNMMLNKWLDYCSERGHRFTGAHA